MVRAAVSGAIDYSRADPTDKNWRMRQRLILSEIQRQEEVELLHGVHRQWLAYISHGGLTPESFADTKTAANDTLRALKASIFPWEASLNAEPKRENDTIIDAETQRLIDSYKAFEAELAATNAAAKAGIK
jgi:hypothetical protein